MLTVPVGKARIGTAGDVKISDASPVLSTYVTDAEMLDAGYPAPVGIKKVFSVAPEIAVPFKYH